jgi:Flp pilus assembly protein TadG
MKFLIAKLKQFSRNDDGAFAVLFGIMAIVLIATGGSSVDFVALQQARKSAQVSLDAAVLALQPEIYSKSSNWIKNRAQRMVDESIETGGITVTVGTPDISLDDGRLTLTAQITRETFFIRLLGISNLGAGLVSEATRAKKLLEVVMVLDNSGSMNSYGRMSALKASANLAVNIISGGVSEPEDVFIGLVPFTQYVNIGNGNRTAKGVDIHGMSPLSWDNFDNDANPSTGHDTSNPSDRLNRLAIYASIPNAEWKGCVEARRHNTALSEADRLDVNDVEPTYGLDTSGMYGFGETLFVPVFEPDMPDNGYNNQAGYMRDRKSGCPWVWNARARQERACKYNGQWVDYGGGLNGAGPNALCLDAEVLPLTNRISDVTGSINAMVADGGTNIHMGAIWGWRVLSPTAPFTEGVAYGEGANKVMILMTDGQNHSSQWGSFNGSYYYSAYGWPYNRRLGDVGWSNSAIRAEMDRRTVMACNNAKAAGIEIYTIGLSISENSDNGRMLTSCSSGSAYDFFPVSTSDLEDTFRAIADQLQDLRLSQ